MWLPAGRTTGGPRQADDLNLCGVDPMSQATETTPDLRRLIHRACAVNLSVDLHLQTYQDEIHVARARMIRHDDESIEFDQPQATGSKIHFRKNQVVQVYMALDGEIYTFQCRIQATDTFLQLNDAKRVRGLRASMPNRVSRGQRRHDYRVSMASLDPIEVRIHAVKDTNLDVCELNAPRCSGILTNLSFGGARVRVTQSLRHLFSVNHLYFLNFTLPDDEGDLFTPAMLRHEQLVEAIGTVLLGFKFIAWPSFPQPSNSQRIHHFCMEVQRKAAARPGAR